MPRKTLPVLLSFNAGYVDAVGFLALQGLFAAHVTGNFVTIGAALVTGASGVVAKLLALPTFALTIFVVAFLLRKIAPDEKAGLICLLAVQTVLLAASAAMALILGPFPAGDHLASIATGLTLVFAMATQNALQKIHLGKLPPTTMMTGTTTQVMIDLADRAAGIADAQLSALRDRMRSMAANLAGFAFGCAFAAVAYAYLGMAAFLLPPAVAAVALWRERT
ncbi:uncharacterized membrane protein YoaK (UPF0700 family) [Rhizobium sp. SG_E_25_P2]|uniref:YoaK family protein n=1 Tax=Rhizobium sp. SG_E_25_P2 TaxID=2879942 RepID=UPI002475B180|nr:YoaK family protein [Rhizobium sp. SG_E_25_P2]MDH6265879.1 uncharacterized membrane protein YoaK (UPF0700 family) [Rhizobium sp. SG_E_25_P2]